MDSWIVYVLIGVCCGTLGASLGIGGGVMLVPVLAILFAFPQKSAQGMSLAAIAPMAIIAAIRYYRNPEIDMDVMIVMFLAIGTIGGAFIGSKIAADLPASTLRKLFAVVLLIAATKMFFFSGAKESPPEKGQSQPTMKSAEESGG